MRLMLLALCLLMPTVGNAQQWTPPPDPDPQTILREAKADTAAGKYEDALAKHLWYHENAIAIEPAQSGVRLSFALSYWLELGEVYRPALEKMRQIRDDTEKRIRDENRVRVQFSDFHDFASLNRTLREEERTAKTFEWLDQTDQEDAKRVFDVAKPALIKQESYELCGKYIDAERDLSRIGESYQMGLKLADERFGKSHQEFAEKKFLNDVTILVAILAKTDRQADADKAAERAKTFVKDDAVLQKLVEQLEPALKGTVPTPWP